MDGGSKPGTSIGLTQAAPAVSFGPALERHQQKEVSLCVGSRSKLLKRYIIFSPTCAFPRIGAGIQVSRGINDGSIYFSRAGLPGGRHG
jgi:hypothetical protein